MATQPDAWGLIPANLDPPASDEEIGVTTDGDGWSPTPTSKVTRKRFVGLLSTAGLLQLRYTLIKRNWYRRRH